MLRGRRSGLTDSTKALVRTKGVKRGGAELSLGTVVATEVSGEQEREAGSPAELVGEFCIAEAQVGIKGDGPEDLPVAFATTRRDAGSVVGKGMPGVTRSDRLCKIEA